MVQTLTTTYFYSEEGLVAEYQAQSDNAAQLQAQYRWQPEGTWGTDPVWIKTISVGGDQTDYFYYQNDHLGTPQKIIDRQGQSDWSQKATAFGETTVDAATTISNNLRFPGQYFDQETGTHYNFFRDYSPSIGRYVKNDPIGLDGGINTYLYANANPIRDIDPKGLLPPSMIEKSLDCARIRLLVWLSCKLKAERCKGTDDCPTLFAKFELSQDCVYFQTLLTQRCYGNRPSHEQVIEDALNRGSRCLGMIARKCQCPGL